jgi:polysaccharide export outer membrane protein
MLQPSAPPRRARPGIALGFALALTFGGERAASAQTTLTEIAPGDVLRIEVVNAPEFSREASVDADGRVALPMLGQLALSGMDLDKARDVVASALRDQGLLNAPDVLIEIAKYRPIYVGGAVREPGSVAFSPGLTVRQAVIAAGGIELGAGLDKLEASPQIALAALAKRRAAAFRMAQLTALIARLEAEIAGADAFDKSDDMPIEAARMAERQHMAQERGEHTDAMLDLVSTELSTLDKQSQLQQQEADLQQSEIDNARSLVDRGLMPRNQYQDMLRELSQLNRDQLENRAYAARAAQQASTLRYELSRSQSEERESIRIELADAQAQREALMAEMAGLELQIMAAGLIGQDSSVAAPITRLVIHRQSGGKSVRIDATMEDAVLPGDVLDLALLPPDPSREPEVGQ